MKHDVKREFVTMGIEYRLVGRGRCECFVELDGKRDEITGSDISDCLGGLADAAVQQLTGATSARVSFDEEPGEYRRLIDRAGQRVCLRIIEFQEL